ncbi:hypothetical protein HY522_07730 [bacterium]|nr:hypothetical protein [bacterium]
MTAAPPSVAELAGLWEEIRDTLETDTGMNLHDERQERLAEAFRQFVHDNRLVSLTDIRERLTDPARRGAAIEEFVSHLTVGETFFFRNADHFRALRETVIPAIIGDRRRDRTLRVWSGGCATGEEPYSIAILIERDFPALAAWDVRILATDISKTFLEKGRAARYRAWSFRQTDIGNDPRYFKQEKDEFILNERIRDRVRFHHLNLVYDAYPSLLMQTVGLDIIFFRNVAIYLKEEVSQSIVRRFARCLRPGGWLLIGEVEISHRLFSEDDFEKIRDGETILLRRRDTEIPMTYAPAPIVPLWRVSHWTSSSPLEGEAGRGGRDAPAVTPHPASPSRGEEIQALQQARSFLADGQVQLAQQLIDRAASAEPLAIEAHLLSAALADEAGDLKSAAESLRRALYLDRDCLMAHLLLGMVLRGGGTPESARIFRNALAIARSMKPAELIPYSDGMCAGRFIQILEQMS